MEPKTVIIFIAVIIMFACSPNSRAGSGTAEQGSTLEIFNAVSGKVMTVERIVRTEKEWKALLSEEQYHILREQGTERAYTGKYHDHKKKGIYKCAACGTDVFSSESKYDSRSGWPSFWEPVSELNVGTQEDRSFFMIRTEVHCARCGSHLGHVFDDGPPPTGKRWCINSLSLDFVSTD